MPIEKEVQELLSSIGVYDVLIPFAIAFALTWGILERTKILGTEEHDGKTPRRKLNIMLALVIGMIAVLAWGRSEAFSYVLQVIIYMIMAFFGLFFISGIFFGSEWRESRLVKIVAGIVGATIVALVFRLYEFVRGAEAFVALLFVLLAFIWSVAYVVRPGRAGSTASANKEEKPSQDALDKFLQDFVSLPPDKAQKKLNELKLSDEDKEFLAKQHLVQLRQALKRKKA